MSGNAKEMTTSRYTETYAGWSTTSEWLEKTANLEIEGSFEAVAMAMWSIFSGLLGEIRLMEARE
jgi:hypothetical protein